MDEYIDMARRIPPRLAGLASVERIPTGQSFAPVREYLANLPAYVGKGVGLFLSGPNGIGKTCSLVLASQRVRVLKPGWASREVMWCTARDIARTYEYGKVDTTFDESVDELYEGTRWLVIDELGRESDIKNHERRMLTLLRKRMDNRLVTSFATNLNLSQAGGPGSVLDMYKEGFWSLLHEACLAATLSGSDLRMSPSP